MDWIIGKGQKIIIYCGQDEADAVQIAAGNLATDLQKVLMAECSFTADKNVHCAIAIQTGQSAYLPAENASPRRESYCRRVCNGTLYIEGADRRGTIYGIYDLCRWIGVSPWYFWADVPVKMKQRIELPEGDMVTDYPSVEYRGVFINDEEELDHWTKLHMGEETIGVNTYEKIFELILRLKGNYIWPAMHVNSFNLKRENGALADKMGIVVGTSHCDMLMRSNNREWKPWIQKKGYTGVEYDYSIPGHNREVLQEYWRESVEQNRDFEVCYTLGMRGIHDSGFEVQALEELSGEALLQAKINLLQQVIKDQENILRDVLGEDKESVTLKTFVPYKEVLELYDNGLEVPEDLTLIWANDNYGYIRRFPNGQEKVRKGGNGIYYHNSYWAPPGGSYLFIDSIPLAHTRNELQKAWNEQIRKLWVMNIGALKPLEEEIEFYFQLAWEIGKPGSMTEDIDAWLECWINETFSGEHGREMADILQDFAQIVNVRKIEQMDADTFSQTAYGDEASMRINALRNLFDRADKIWKSLPQEEQDAFFELCLMKIHAAYITNCMYYYADRSALCVKKGKNATAAECVALCRAYEDARRKMLVYYGEKIAGGKWNGILTPEDFPPPRTAMYPACMPPKETGDAELVVECWNEEDGIYFVRDCEKWVQLSNVGTGTISYEIIFPEWIQVSEKSGRIGKEAGMSERRILLRADRNKMKKAQERLADVLSVLWHTDRGEEEHRTQIPVSVDFSRADAPHLEDGGICRIRAVDALELEGAQDWPIRSGARQREGTGFKVIPGLGRHTGSQVEALQEKGQLHYLFTVTTPGVHLLEVHRFPSLNASGRIRVRICLDEEEPMLLESASTDEWKGTWKINVRNNVDKLCLTLPEMKIGTHCLTVEAVDPYFAFDRLAIYTKPMKYSMLGGVEGDSRLPEKKHPSAFLPYWDLALSPRDMLCAPRCPSADCLVDEDLRIPQKAYGREISMGQLLEMGRHPISERRGKVRIDAAVALAESQYAFTSGYPWDYCGSESYGRTGIAMYVRKQGLTFPAEQAPTLNYCFHLSGGHYTLWIYMRCTGQSDSRLGVMLQPLGQTGIVQGDILEKCLDIWRYSAEQVYRWVPVGEWDLREGDYLLQVESFVSGLRLDRIYLTAGEEFPPVDADWEV